MNPLTLLTGVWGYVAAAVIAAALAVGATHFIDAKSYGLEISNLELKASQQQTQSITASLTQLQNFIATMHTADTGYQTGLAAITANFAAIEKELKSATIKPLPVDCRPDVGRLRVLTDATAAANAKASGAGK